MEVALGISILAGLILIVGIRAYRRAQHGPCPHLHPVRDDHDDLFCRDCGGELPN